MRPILSLVLVALATSSLAQYPGSEPVEAGVKPGFDAIKIDEAKRILTKLASDELEGRGSGYPGYRKAAAFIAEEFHRLGLKPVGDLDSYYQNVRFIKIKPDMNASFVRGADGNRYTLESEVSWTGGPLDADGPMVLLTVRGAGTTIPAIPQLKDAVVILDAPEVDQALLQGLQAQGPAAVLEVKSTVRAEPTYVRPATWGSQIEATKIAEISATTAQALLKGAAYRGDQSAVPATGYKVTELQGRASAHAQFATSDVLVPNVVGLLEGSDPKLKQQVVVVSAHLDHLGSSGKTIWHGADDNGSGSTGVVLVAEAMKAIAHRPKRSILFVTFCGEELGLIGSGYYVSHPIYPLADTVADLQMDMIGRNAETAKEKPQDNDDTLRLIGSEHASRTLRNTVERWNRYVHIRLLFDMEWLYPNSDHASFGGKNVACALFFDGLHPDLHQPTDTVDKINWRKLTTSAKLVYLVANDLANRTSTGSTGASQ